MKRSVGLWQLCAFAFAALGGTLLHFLYGWLGDAIWIAPFSGVNESTFEHMKLLFWPMLLFGAVQGRFFRNRRDFWSVKLRGILLGQMLIPVFFYTYNGAIGKSPAWVNILIFFLSAAIVSFTEARRLWAKEAPSLLSPKASIAALLFLAALFVLFTFRTPELGLFQDPVTGTYGI